MSAGRTTVDWTMHLFQKAMRYCVVGLCQSIVRFVMICRDLIVFLTAEFALNVTPVKETENLYLKRKGAIESSP